MRQYGYTIKASQLVVLCYDNPSKPMQLRNRMISCYMWTLRHRKVKCLSKVTQITRGRQAVYSRICLLSYVRRGCLPIARLRDSAAWYIFIAFFGGMFSLGFQAGTQLSRHLLYHRMADLCGLGYGFTRERSWTVKEFICFFLFTIGP